MTLECRVNMSRNEDEYELLKREFCELWNSSSNYPLGMVLNDPDKPCVTAAVNSQRQLEDIRCIEDLLKILEHRNALNCEKPHLLKTIALYCISTTDNTNNDWAHEAIHMVTKFMDDHNIGKKETFVPFVLNYENVLHVNRSTNVEPAAVQLVAVNQDEDLVLDNCLRYLRSKFGTIGIRWPEFLRALPIKECKIEKLRSLKPNAEAFGECLEHWKLNSPPTERSRATLIKAAHACELREIAEGLWLVDLNYD